MTNRHILILSVGGALIMCAVIWAGWSMRNLDCRDFDEATVMINNHSYNMALADTDTERAQGLQACHTIPDDSGMLFILSEREIPGFWMKSMVIPLDIIWIRDGKVVGLENNVPPLTNQTDNPLIYSPDVPIDAVIEVPANQAAKFGLTLGASVQY